MSTADATDATLLEVRGPDRRGLLGDVGRVLCTLGVSVRSAHIETYAGHCQDTFYLQEATGGGALSAARAAQVVAALAEL